MNQAIIQRNNVQIIGKGSQPIIFAHGFGCSQTIWRFITPSFLEQYQIILFDYVGSGHSQFQAFDPERYNTIEGYVQDLIDICEALQLSHTIFIGHSISGMIGGLASIQHPEYFQKLVLIGSSACYINDQEYTGGFTVSDIQGLLDLMEKNYRGWANFLAPLVMKNQDRPELAQDLEETFLTNDPRISHYFAQATFNIDKRLDLPFISIPTLIIQSRDDMIVPISAASYLQTHIPSNTMKLINATGHYPHVSNPAEIIQLIQAYIAPE